MPDLLPLLKCPQHILNDGLAPDIVWAVIAGSASGDQAEKCGLQLSHHPECG
jgi:hypothetical protein